MTFHFSKRLRHVAVAAVASVAMIHAVAPAEAAQQKISKSFVQPLAPSPSAKPSDKLPNLGRDKHGMPFYHPKQLRRVVRTTAYTHSESDHVAYGARNAMGTSLQYGERYRSAAADWSVYPLGTMFKIKGQPYTYIVDDYGSALVGTGTIDIYQPTRSLMKQWGRRIVEIEVVRWGSSRLSMETLAKRRSFSHCAKMHRSLTQQDSKREKNTRNR